MSSFSSKFSSVITNMLEYRVALGLSENTSRSQLKHFDRYCIEHYPECEVISKDLVFDWLGNLTESDSTNIVAYASAIRHLA